MAEILTKGQNDGGYLLFSSIVGRNSVGERQLREEILLGGDFCWDGGVGLWEDQSDGGSN